MFRTLRAGKMKRWAAGHSTVPTTKWCTMSCRKHSYMVKPAHSTSLLLGWQRRSICSASIVEQSFPMRPTSAGSVANLKRKVSRSRSLDGKRAKFSTQRLKRRGLGITRSNFGQPPLGRRASTTPENCQYSNHCTHHRVEVVRKRSMPTMLW